MPFGLALPSFLAGRRRINLFLLCLGVSLLQACGNVGDPLPPLIQIPKPISDLSVLQLGKNVKLSWTLPKLNTDGSAATTLQRVEIYRLRSKSVTHLDPATFAHLATKWLVIDEVNFEAYREGEKLVLTDALTALNDQELFQSVFSYAIKALNGKKQDAGFSNFESVRIHPVPRPPERVRPSYAEDHIEVRWEAPLQNIDDSTLSDELRFHVYRSSISEARVRELLTRTPISETSFKDQSMVLGKTYYYAVRCVVSTREGLVESSDSQEVEATNVDVYSPRVPQEITAISDGQFISLVWLPNTESDLAGYHVYRSGEERDFKPLTGKAITSASYFDESVEKGKTYHYRVTAIDVSGNESSHSKEAGDKIE